MNSSCLTPFGGEPPFRGKKVPKKYIPLSKDYRGRKHGSTQTLRAGEYVPSIRLEEEKHNTGWEGKKKPWGGRGQFGASWV